MCFTGKKLRQQQHCQHPHLRVSRGLTTRGRIQTVAGRVVATLVEVEAEVTGPLLLLLDPLGGGVEGVAESSMGAEVGKKCDERRAARRVTDNQFDSFLVK